MSTHALLKQFLSQESFDPELDDVEIPAPQPVEPDDLLDAEDNLDEVESVLDELRTESQDGEIAVEQARREIVALEHLLEVLNHGVETQQYSPQFAAIVGASLEHYREVFGEEAVGLPSLESFSGDNLEQFYTVSQESVRGFINRLLRVVPAAVDRTANRLVDAIGDLANDAKISGINKIADAALANVKGANEAKEVSLRGNEALLNMGGTFVDNPVAAVTEDRKNRQQLFKAIVIPYMQQGPALHKLIGEAVQSGGAKTTSNILKAVLDISMPTVPGAMQSGRGFLNGMKLELVEQTQKGSKLSEQIKSIGKNRIVIDTVSKPSGKLGVVKVTSRDVVTLANLAKAYAVLFEQTSKQLHTLTNAQATSRMINQIRDRSQLYQAQLATWEDDKALDYTLTLATNRQAWAHALTIRSLRETAVVGKRVAQLALKLSKQFAKAK